MSFPVEPTIDKLLFEELSWQRFERLCCDLADEKFIDLVNVRPHLGQGNTQDGIDIRGFDPKDKSYVYIQSKRVKNFTGSNVLEAIELFCNGKFYADSKTFILCVSSKLNERYEEAIKEVENRFANDNKTFIIWDEVALNRILRRHPQIVFDSFDGGNIPNWTKAFCGEESLKKLIHRPQNKIYKAPENYIPRKRLR